MKRLELLDYARLFAAVAVILFHYCALALTHDRLHSFTLPVSIMEICKYGHLGVPFFFMISGYVIFYSALDRSPGKFASARVARLYPTFWVCMTITAACIYFWGLERMTVYPSQFLAHLTMIPRDIQRMPYIDGAYWTLHWELYFYLLVFVLLLLKAKARHLTLFFQVWPVVMLALWLGGMDNLPFLSSLYPLFAAGAVFAILARQVSWLSIVALACSYILCMKQYLFLEEFGEESAWVVGLIITSFFVFFFYLNSARGSAMKLPGSKLAGALTYPVYLLHQTIGYIVLERMASEQTKYLWLAITILGIFVMAYVVHEVIEKQMAGFWRWLFGWTVAWPVDQLVAGTNRLAGIFRPGTAALAAEAVEPE